MAKKPDNKDIKNLQKELDIAKKATRLVNVIDPSRITNLEAFTIKANESLKEECTIITQLGDCHVDEIVNKNIINDINEYNPTIARTRIERYFKRLIYMINTYRRTGMKIENLVLHLVGDNISGWIHDELRETNSISPIKAIMMSEELIIKGIKTLAEQAKLQKIVVICSVGNHGRLTEKKQHKNNAETNLEYLMYHSIAKYFQIQNYSNVEFIISESEFIYYNIYGKINRFSHGNHFRYQGGIGGIEVPLKKWVHREMTIKPFDMAWIGHWHQYLVGTKVRINGSVKGYDEFSRNIGAIPEPPQQQFQLLDSKRGFTINCPIILEDF